MELGMDTHTNPDRPGPPHGPGLAEAKARLKGHAFVLVGLMGAGKTTVGRRLAKALGLPFIDADAEIETAAGLTVAEIFERFGEAYFRDGEKRVMARLLGNGPQVLATGGGAFLNEETRALIAEKAVSVWLQADLDVLVKRVSRRRTRPLLKGRKPREVLTKLLAERAPVYALADVTVTSDQGPHSDVVSEIIRAADAYLAPRGAAP